MNECACGSMSVNWFSIIMLMFLLWIFFPMFRYLIFLCHVWLIKVEPMIPVHLGWKSLLILEWNRSFSAEN
jgi:TctA family transporter